MEYSIIMKYKTVQIESIVTLMTVASVLKYLPKAVVDKIKSYDSDPVFALMTVGCQGEMTGELFTGTQRMSKASWYKQLWPVKAVKQLTAVLKEKLVPIYADIHDATGERDRVKLGEVLASRNAVVEGSLHSMAVANISDIPTRAKLKSGEYDVCSMEAKCIFSKAESASQLLQILNRPRGTFFYTEKTRYIETDLKKNG